MRLEQEYLSDEALEQLILEVEQQELVAAPPGILERVLDGIESVSENSNHKEERTTTSDNKVREFRAYCVRVLTSVAAAIMIIFMLPELLNTQAMDVVVRQDMVTQEKYMTEEKAWKDTGILTQTLGGVNIFDNDNELNIFNGG